MKSNNFSGQKKKSFLSLRVKMLGGYVLVLMIIMILVAYFLPSILSNYLLSEKKNDLEKNDMVFIGYDCCFGSICSLYLEGRVLCNTFLSKYMD